MKKIIEYLGFALLAIFLIAFGPYIFMNGIGKSVHEFHQFLKTTNPKIYLLYKILIIIIGCYYLLKVIFSKNK